jgi:thymidylate synthase (FAD)
LRYVQEEEGDYYVPSPFLGQASTNKQGSAEPIEKQVAADVLFQKQCADSWEAYKNLLDLGVSREQARGVLNPAFYTSWVWTASLQSVLHFISLRTGEGAQSEIQKYALAVEELITPFVPYTLEAWKMYV